MNEDIVIDVKNISKKYTIATEYQPDTLREKIVELSKYPLRILKGSHKKPKTKEHWALKDVSFQVKRGEVLGIIGKNGAGKSTLLKILSRTTEPTRGSITMRGRVASLLEVGTGFNPELTGRENIYLNGSIIGMSRKEIDRKFNNIVEFAEIGEFLDTPVKRYSSGMYVRLAFSVAAHLDTDILLLDEVLAVGDSEFQQKSFRKIIDIVKDGKTVIMVSHNMSIMSKHCHRLLYIKGGKKISIGNPSEVSSEYAISETNIKNSDIIVKKNDNKQWSINTYAEIKVSFSKKRYGKEFECDLVAYNSSKDKIFVLQSQNYKYPKLNNPKEISFFIKNVGFSTDLYIDIGFRKNSGEHYDSIVEKALILHPDLNSLPQSSHKDDIISPESYLLVN